MKTKNISTITTMRNPHIEEIIRKKDAEFQSLSKINAKHFAFRQLPKPKGDSLLPYIGDIIAKYEGLAADVRQQLQPQVHLPKAKLQADLAAENEKRIDDEIERNEQLNHIDKLEIGDFHPGLMHWLIIIAILATAGINIGEAVFNMQAFQIIGESLLFSLLVSVGLSIALFVVSHFIAVKYKKAQTRQKKLIILCVALTTSTLVFIVLAILRSRFLEKQHIEIASGYLVILNILLFFSSVLLSYLFIPSWSEIRQHYTHIKKYFAIERREKKIEMLESEKTRIKPELTEQVNTCLEVAYYYNYLADCIEKKCTETIRLFISTNLMYRTDREMPDCIHAELPKPNIQHPNMNPLNINNKN